MVCAIEDTLGVCDPHLIVGYEPNVFLSGLVLHCVESLAYQIIQIEIVFVKFKVHCLEFGQIEQVVDKSRQHARLEKYILQILFNLSKNSLQLLLPYLLPTH